MRRRALAYAAAALLAAATAAAQTAPPTRVRGTIESIDGQSLAVKAREGGTVDIKLADNMAVLGVTKASLADIAVGTFVGAAALPQPDGTLKAIEVLVFPEAARGSGEGHYPWDLLPESTMTNATVAETVAGVTGPTLTLKYKDGEKKVVVPPEAPIVTRQPLAAQAGSDGVRARDDTAGRYADGGAGLRRHGWRGAADVALE
jgi:uncharacterized low-complexity protein